MQANISQSLISDLSKRIKREPLTKPLEVRDNGLKGFILRIQPSGGMSYVVQVARAKRLTLGRVPVITPTRARRKAQIALGAVADGRDPRDALRVDDGQAAPSLSEYVEDRYGEWIIANRKTGAELVARLKACFFAEFGDTPLDQITPWNVEKWRRARLQQGRAMGTINRDLSTLKAALSRAVDWELIDQNPLIKVKPGREDRHGVVRYLSADEEIRLREALKARDAELRAGRERGNAWRRDRGRGLMPELGAYADNLTPMVFLSLNTGMRQGEVFNLRWEHVDLTRQSLAIHGDGAKSGKTRHIPLNAEAIDVLRIWRGRGAGIGYVFPGRQGKRLDNVKKAWAGLLKDALITGFRWHDMRHHFASRLVMVGVDLNTVRELLGHSDIKMTLRYAHLAPEHKAAAVAKLVPPADVVGVGGER